MSTATQRSLQVEEHSRAPLKATIRSNGNGRAIEWEEPCRLEWQRKREVGRQPARYLYQGRERLEP